VASQLASERFANRTRRVKVTETVAREIVEEMSRRGLTPGSPLATEAELAADFDVSRATMREALRILETNGLVRVRPGRGGGLQVGEADPRAFGRTLTWFLQMKRTEFWELLEARAILEPMMAGLAARRRDEAALRNLSAAVERHRGLERRDQSGWLEVTQQFHSLLAGLSGNGVLDLFGRALTEIYTERTTASERPMRRRDAVLKEHEAVVNAILAGDAQGAEALMRSHMKALVRGFERDYASLRDEIIGWW
jgi:GntR family transcriptional regulator, transcriptional repressor for pyruvate dehydrogenase complex